MKLGNLYDLARFQAFADSGSAAGFQDSDSGVVLARNLTAVDPKIFEKKFPELAFVNSGVQVDNSGGYAKRIQSLRTQEIGGFANAGDQSGNKGKISLAGEDSFLKVLEREAHSKWSDSEIKEADLQGINLVSRYVQSHNGIYLREIDEAGYVGMNGNEGLLNSTAFTSGAAAGAIGTLTAQQMYDEFAGLITDQHNGVNNTPEYMATRVDMPIPVMNTLKSTMLNTAAGSSSVLKALQDNFPDVTFRSTFRANDVGGSSVTAAYSVNDEAMKMRVPVPLTIGEIVKISSFNFQIDSKYRVAGLDVLESTAGRLLTGL